jgi:plasmid replication initiation protein
MAMEAINPQRFGSGYQTRVRFALSVTIDRKFPDLSGGIREWCDAVVRATTGVPGRIEFLKLDWGLRVS